MEPPKITQQTQEEFERDGGHGNIVSHVESKMVAINGTV